MSIVKRMHNTVNVYSEIGFDGIYSQKVYMAQSKKTCRHSFSDSGGSSPPLCRASCLGSEDEKVGEKKEEARVEKEEERVEEVEVVSPIPDPCGIILEG